MLGNDRVALRGTLLNELYEHYFANGGVEKSVFEEFKDAERKLAYLYLEDLGLIRLNVTEGSSHILLGASAAITARGINAVESDQEISKL